MLTGLLRLLAGLPLWVFHAAGAGLGWLLYLAAPRYAARLRENLEMSGLCRGGCRPLLHQAIAETGKGALELLPVWLRPLPRVLSLVRECHGWEHVEAARRRGKGLIFLTPHLGCFEIISLYVASRFPLTVLYRPPKLRWLQPLLEAGRSRAQVTLAATDLSGVRALLRTLKRGESIGILPDQVPGQGEGVWADFFGRPAYTMTLVPRLARASGAAIILAAAIRLPRGRGFDLWFEPFSFDLPDDPVASAGLVNQAMENLIRKDPAQYLWSYNRYKVPKGVKGES